MSGGEAHHLTRCGDVVRGVDAMRAPRLVEGDLRGTRGAPQVEVEAQQVAFVRPAIVDRHRHRQQVADVAHRGVDVDDPPVEEADPSVVEEEVADVGVAVDHCVRALVPEPLQLVVMGDVDLGDVDEGIGESVPVVVDALAQHPRGVVTRRPAHVHPRRLGGATRGIVEADVQRGEVFDCARGRVDRNAPGAIGHVAACGHEILEQEREATVVVGACDVRLGNPHRDRRRQLGVEARFPMAHASGDDLGPPLVVGRQLAEHRVGRVVAGACT